MSDWAFWSYDKIPERLDLDEHEWRALKKQPWIVSEKIHGANFVLASDGREVRAGNRKDWIAPDDEFFGHRALVERYAPNVRQLFAALAVEHPGLQRIFVYGELYGGAYPHPDVAPVPGVEPVQSGVYYAPGIELAAFDIGLVVGDAAQAPATFDYEQTMRALAAAKIPHAPTLFIGKYEQATAQSIDFDSRVPALHGLPALPRNRAEGVVIKPLHLGRPAVKRKPEAFAEARYHAAQKWTGKGSPLPHLQTLATALVTRQRLDNALSKIGRVRKHDAAKLATLTDDFVADVLASLGDAEAEAMARLPKRERELLRAHVTEQARALVAAAVR